METGADPADYRAIADCDVHTGGVLVKDLRQVGCLPGTPTSGIKIVIDKTRNGLPHPGKYRLPRPYGDIDCRRPVALFVWNHDYVAFRLRLCAHATVSG